MLQSNCAGDSMSHQNPSVSKHHINKEKVKDGENVSKHMKAETLPNSQESNHSFRDAISSETVRQGLNVPLMTSVPVWVNLSVKQEQEEMLIKEEPIELSETMNEHAGSSNVIVNEDTEDSKIVGILLVFSNTHDFNFFRHQTSNSKHSRFKNIKIVNYSCDKCSYETKERNCYMAHMKIHSEEVLKCKNCNYETYTFSKLQKHSRMHSTVGCFKCSFCDFEADSISKLDSHTQEHNPSRRNKCNVCKRHFYSNSALAAHMKDGVHLPRRRIPARSEEPLRCSKCDFETECRRTFIKHTLSHDKVYKCCKCNYENHLKFRYLSHLKVHEERKYTCKEEGCNYKYNTYRQLKLHLKSRYHSDRTIQCKLCPYKTYTKDLLRLHSVIHSEKEHLCDKCGKAFHRKDNLKTHMVMHSSDKKFECDVCHFKCNRRDNLKTHMLQHVSAKLYNCTYCNYGSNNKKYVDAHLIKKHLYLLGATPDSKEALAITEVAANSDLSEDTVDPKLPEDGIVNGKSEIW